MPALAGAQRRAGGFRARARAGEAERRVVHAHPVQRHQQRHRLRPVRVNGHPADEHQRGLRAVQLLEHLPRAQMRLRDAHVAGVRADRPRQIRICFPLVRPQRGVEQRGQILQIDGRFSPGSARDEQGKRLLHESDRRLPIRHAEGGDQPIDDGDRHAAAALYGCGIIGEFPDGLVALGQDAQAPHLPVHGMACRILCVSMRRQAHQRKQQRQESLSHGFHRNCLSYPLYEQMVYGASSPSSSYA